MQWVLNDKFVFYKTAISNSSDWNIQHFNSFLSFEEYDFYLYCQN